MSPKRSQKRQRRQLLLSVAIVVGLAIGALAAVVGAGWKPQLGLDLDGGLQVLYQPTHHASTDALNEAVNILNERVNALGVSGAQVDTQGGNIAVSIPGIKDPQEVLNTIGKTAQLYFRPVLCYAPPYTSPKKQAAVSPGPLPTSCPQNYALVPSNLSGSVSSTNGVSYQLPPDPPLVAYPSSATDDPHAYVLQPPSPGTGFPDRYLEGPAELTGTAVKSATAQLSQTGEWVVNVDLTGAGSAGWDAMTQKYFHQIIGIDLDGHVQSAPINQPTQTTWSSYNGQVEISGNFTQSSAQALAVALQFGALPVPLHPLTTQTVSATLGRASLQAGLGAGVAGLVLVLLYILIYYRLLGLVVISGLLVTAAYIWTVITALGHTRGLTVDLAGITGIIVSIGITVDSYVVYFERLKDEVRAGRSVRTSVERGFKSVWHTVLAADLVSLIGAVVIYVVAVGNVKGFAFYLGLSTLLDLVITYFYTRPLVILLGTREAVNAAGRFSMARGLSSTT